MLNQDTKRKIDSARQILVGKVPDPKAQVEQITTALIYKFMDDMDKEAQELGGKARFFTNGYEKYAWTKLMDTRIGGQDRLNLYVEAITTLSQNPHLPQLFRDIFKDTFLPYRDPETLNLFLKELNSFTYDHSEDLGDAFEYLLSILGSQGDAGQFRTPRHIIDFIVSIVDPKKGETILDPACGTAGFLISAYKHILKQNHNKPLTPDEKKKLMQNLVGYDISPDMVRLSRVNMYLHGFPEPKIDEYDTLTSEDKWGETYDVIMANPPFMTPKGGIRPHKRFFVTANRSEILFVDYIAEHLNIKGKAGVIVPDGVVNGITKASHQLRKHLTDNNLYCVVSLPAGVFHPYSGVKTYILLLNKNISKLSESILFIKINNDGFDLGANRRKINKNDLTQAFDLIKDFEESIITNSSFKIADKDKNMAIVVKKDSILSTTDCNLSGERYREHHITKNSKWPLVLLGEVCEFEGGSQPPKSQFIYSPKNGYINFIQIRDFGENGIETYIPISSKNRLCKTDDVLIARYGASLGRICTGLSGAYNVALLKTVPNETKINKQYLYYLLKSSYIQNRILQLGNRAAQAGIRPSDLKNTKIYLPTLAEQKEIVFEFQREENKIEELKQEIEKHNQNIDVKIEGLCGD
jgi:type I restriction enzyme M protein